MLVRLNRREGGRMLIAKDCNKLTLILPSMRKASCSYNQIETVLRFCSRLKMKWIGANKVLRPAMMMNEELRR
jgi:hypothetical protein